ncbi:aa3-type cytochrome c oxidase subunit IV [Thalassospira mesophila]|nr:aa3-type cytochrome c oxidase subunit IV [Thalassospira mesophila]
MQGSEYDANLVREHEKTWHNFVWFLFTNVLAAAATLLFLMIFFL